MPAARSWSGPESAGAVPGPACYGRGGTQPTVTDADLVLGRIGADTGFAGLDRLDVSAARAALDRAGVTAAGVVAVVDAAMERAVRAVTVEQGVDPRELALVAFGGAGPLHACAVADALGVRTVIVPARAGVFSAVGIVCTPALREIVRSWPDPRGRAGLDAARADLAHAVELLLGPATENDAGPMEVETFVDCRYTGQSHELTVRTPEEFPAEHARRNGYAREGAPIEVVAVRARASRRAPLDTRGAASTGTRARVTGPLVVAEPDCTAWVPDGWVAEPGPTGAWVLARVARAGEPRSGVVADPDLTAGWDRRRDGRGAAPRRVQPEHQRARRLLGRALHGHRRAARAGRAHPRAPRFDARVGAAAIAAITVEETGSGPRPGDEIVVNDPFAGGTHLNDITLVAPCFVGNELVGWVANRAHHADVGGIAPGSMPPDAIDIAEEGLRIAPDAARRPNGRADRDLVAYTGRAARRSRRAARRQSPRGRAHGHGVESLGAVAPLAEIVDYGERRMRAALRALPDGRWRAEDVLDSAGPRPSSSSRRALRSRSPSTASMQCSTSPVPTRSAPGT